MTDKPRNIRDWDRWYHEGTVSFADPPFCCPPDIPPIIIDLPFPISTNCLHKSSRGHVYRTKAYEAWIKNCDATILLNRQYPRQRITGLFELELLLSNKGRGDGDNRIKAVLDYLQSREITPNDLFCRRGRWEWVPPHDAPNGARVTVRAIT